MVWEVLARFLRALERGAEDAEGDADVVRSALLDFTETPQSVAEAMALPTFEPTVTTDQVQQIVDFATRWGGLTERVHVEELVAEIES